MLALANIKKFMCRQLSVCEQEIFYLKLSFQVMLWFAATMDALASLKKYQLFCMETIGDSACFALPTYVPYIPIMLDATYLACYNHLGAELRAAKQRIQLHVQVTW